MGKRQAAFQRKNQGIQAALYTRTGRVYNGAYGAGYHRKDPHGTTSCIDVTAHVKIPLTTLV